MTSHDGGSRARSTAAAVVILLMGSIVLGWVLAPSLVASVIHPVWATLNGRDDPSNGEATATPSGDVADATPAVPSETAPPVPQRRLRVVTRPRGADVTVTPEGGGATVTGTSPFTARVPREP